MHGFWRIFREDLGTFLWVATMSVVTALVMGTLGAGLGLWIIWLTR